MLSWFKRLMKTILILTGLLVQLSAEAKQYVVHVNHVASLQPEHTVLNTLLQKDITIDTDRKTLKVRMSPACTQSNLCPEMVKYYQLNIKKLGSVIQAEGSLPLQSSPSLGKTMITMEKTADNSTLVKIHDASGTSTLVAGPMEETVILF